MNHTLQIFLTRFITAALFTAVLGGAWDIWWHEAVGRESFFIPPHLLIQFSVLVAIAASILGWHRMRERIWLWLAALLLLAPISAPFDEMWHRLFGVENLTSPLSVWSPPHLLLIGSILSSFILLLSLLHRHRGVSSQQIFGGLAFAGILWLLTVVVAPVHPRGPHELLGFWGAGVGAFVFVGVALLVQKWMPGLAEATLTAALFLIPFLIVSGFHEHAPQVIIPPHAHPPIWLTVFAYALPVIWLDLFRRPPHWYRAAFAGFLWAGTLYGFASLFLETGLRYTASDTLIAIIAGIAGGFLAGKGAARFAARLRGH